MVDISECRSTMENFFEDVTILTDQRHPFASKSRAEHTAYSSWTRKAWLACDFIQYYPRFYRFQECAGGFNLCQDFHVRQNQIAYQGYTFRESRASCG